MKRSMNMGLVALLVGALLVADILVFIALGVGSFVPWVLLAILIAVPILHNRMESSHFLSWKDEYSVGVPVIDDDHKRLLYLINNLETAIDYNAGDEFEKKALDELVQYTQYHFSREEGLMEKAGYPDLEAHKKEHRAMIAKVESFVAEYEAKGHDVLEGIADYLGQWLVNHINGTDQQYAPFLRDKGEG